MNHLNDQDDYLNKLTELIWANDDEPNDYLAANDKILEKISTSKSPLDERAEPYRANDLKQFYDPLFPTYNANSIPDSPFAVAEGPNEIALNHPIAPGCIARFFENTLFNQAFPIKSILAIGHPGAHEKRGDFTPYFSEGTHRFIQNTSAEYIVQSQAHESLINTYTLSVTNPKGKQQTAHVIWLPLADLQPLPTHPTTIKTLTHAYQVSLQENLLIHCAAGVGRTGAALLSFIILNQRSSIFKNPELESVAPNIRRELMAIRSVRPAFITTKNQLKSAIKCAIYIDNTMKDRKNHNHKP